MYSCGNHNPWDTQRKNLLGFFGIRRIHQKTFWDTQYYKNLILTCNTRAPIPPDRRKMLAGDPGSKKWPGLRKKFGGKNSAPIWKTNFPPCRPPLSVPKREDRRAVAVRPHPLLKRGTDGTRRSTDGGWRLMPLPEGHPRAPPPPQNAVGSRGGGSGVGATCIVAESDASRLRVQDACICTPGSPGTLCMTRTMACTAPCAATAAFPGSVLHMYANTAQQLRTTRGYRRYDLIQRGWSARMSQQHRGCRIQDPGDRGKHQTKTRNPWRTSRGCRVQNLGPWLPVVKNSRLFAQRAHSARCAPLEYGSGALPFSRCADLYGAPGPWAWMLVPAPRSFRLKKLVFVTRGEGGGQNPQMVLLSWQLAVSINFSPLKKIRQAAVLAILSWGRGVPQQHDRLVALITMSHSSWGEMLSATYPVL